MYYDHERTKDQFSKWLVIVVDEFSLFADSQVRCSQRRRNNFFFDPLVLFLQYMFYKSSSHGNFPQEHSPNLSTEIFCAASKNPEFVILLPFLILQRYDFLLGS